jgi:hypothetical protein
MFTVYHTLDMSPTGHCAKMMAIKANRVTVLQWSLNKGLKKHHQKYNVDQTLGLLGWGKL